MTLYLIVSLLVSSFLAYVIGWNLGRIQGFKRGLFIAQDTLAHMLCDPKTKDLVLKMANREIPIEKLPEEVMKAMTK